MQQTTLAETVVCCGLGLHSGKDVELTLRPAAADSGIRFVRGGGEGQSLDDAGILASPAAVRSTQRATTLGGGSGDEAEIATVEHLLATFYALDIHNVRIEVAGPEVPVTDGSAAPLLEWVRRAGRVSLAERRREIEILSPVEILDGDRLIRIGPNAGGGGLRIDYAIDFPHPCIGFQSIGFEELNETVFEREIAGARTFGFANEVESLRAAGLAQGGSFENTIVLDETSVLNPEPLRWPDEFVRHKVLDLVGDLALFGATLHGHVEVVKGGHALHHALVCALRDDASLWRVKPEGTSAPNA
ncbi:MAG: UDP-3-O-acyl-N-acetylglucosamine deacetylase [Myxococcota bacterium]